MGKIEVCGIRFDNVTLKEAVREAMRDEGEATTVVTPNALMMEESRRHPEYRELLNGASLVLADGEGALIAARRQGTPLCSKVAGIEFGEAVLAHAAATGERVFLLGGRDGVATGAAERLRERFPGLTVCGCYWGYFDRYGEENRQVRGFINACRPSILFVCFGFPTQEEWIRENIPFLPSVRLAAGLGGSLDVWSGAVRRAPALIRACRMEWAWRMMEQPSRLKKLPALVRFDFFSHRNGKKYHKMHTENPPDGETRKQN